MRPHDARKTALAVIRNTVRRCAATWCRVCSSTGRCGRLLPKAQEVKRVGGEADHAGAAQGPDGAASGDRAAFRIGRLVDGRTGIHRPDRGAETLHRHCAAVRRASGGYTRIIKLSDFRIGDGGNLVLLQLATEASAAERNGPALGGLRRKRNEKRHQFARDVMKKSKTEPEQPAAGEKSAAE